MIGGRDDAGEVHDVHLQEVDVGCDPLWGSDAHVNVGAVFC